jgi:uncharacterized protein
MKDASHSILWRRLDHPGHEAAWLFFNDDFWHLHGTAVFLHNNVACRLDYRIARDQRWVLNNEDCPQVARCIDLDLNFSPSTNLLPIRRLALSVGAEQEVRAAWLRFPSFELEPLTQVYRRTDQNIYRYESAGGKFVRDLSVNDVGFVTKYEDFWEIERPN